MPEISVVIPTLQRKKELLINLIKNLEKDESVKEIIVIDNSTKGLDYKSEKLNLIIPKENLYVNPSWNLGVKEAKTDIIALLNDDIIIPDNFCSAILSKMTKETGAIGANVDYIEIIDEIKENPPLDNLTLEKVNYRNPHWGIMIFFYKENYKPIPEDVKIFHGDDWIFDEHKKLKKQNYFVANTKIYHHESLSVGSMKGNPYLKKDKKTYRAHTLKWYEHIFSIHRLFRGFRIILFGIEITYHTQKSFNHRRK